MGRGITKGEPVEAPKHRPPAAEPATASFRRSGTEELLSLQKCLGNRTTSRLIAQAKLDVGPAGDPLEREADRIADVVVRNLRSGGNDATGGSQGGPGQSDREGGQAAGTLQRAAGNAEGIISLEGGEASESLERSIQSARRAGDPLAADTQERFGSAFGGADFRRVRLHVGPEASSLNRQMSASAFTVGNDIFFRGTAPDTGTRDGARLLAHELAHTIQQGASPLDARSTSRMAGTTKVQQATGDQAVVARRGHRPLGVQRRGGDKQSQTAKVIGAGITAQEGLGGVGQVGHWMDVWVDIDAGTNPVAPIDARLNSVYGLELEYWEWVSQTDATGTSGVKPWNDIFAMKPKASTFDTNTTSVNAGMTWEAAVQAAGSGTLKGRHRIGFRDIPGLVPKAGRTAERTLKFRIIFNDGVTRKEIYATQYIKMANGAITYRAYEDSLGNKLESGADQSKRLQKTDVPSKVSPGRSLPPVALSSLHGFVDESLKGTADPFVDLEMAEFVRARAANRKGTSAKGFMAGASDFLRGDLAEGVAAGQFYIPSIAGATRYQKAVAGGLMVSLVRGKNVERAYFTDGATTAVNLKAVTSGMPEPAATRPSIPMRSFAEIPTELVRQAVNETSPLRPVVTQNVQVTGEATHLRAFAKQGDRFVVRIGKDVGPRLKPGTTVTVEPDTRDITGAWVKATYGLHKGFVRATKVGLGAAVAPVGGDFSTDAAESMKAVIKDRIRNRNTATLTADLGPAAETELVMSIAADLASGGEGQATYDGAVAAYPGCTDLVDAEYRKAFGLLPLARRRIGAGPSGALMNAVTTAQDRAAAVTAVMQVIHNQPGKGDDFEMAYNADVPPLGLPVPATLGELVNEGFRQILTAGRGSVTTFDQIVNDYPDFTYRLRPAYRELFGEAQLTRILDRSEQRRMNAAVPNPGSQANTQACDAFLGHAPFTLTDFVPTAGGADNGKFDARYDPSTGELVITVKVFYQFDANTGAYPEQAPGPTEGGLSPELISKTWTDSAKNDFKTRYAATAVGSFNAGARRIDCIRPGWDQVSATPRFEIEEVAQPGAKHFTVAAVKSFLRAEGTGSRMDAGMASGLGADQLVLRQYDVFEKINSPLVHDYCHRQEISGNVETAYALDHRRLVDFLGRVGTIGPGANERTAIRNIADGLLRLKIPSSLATLHPISVTATQALQPAALRRAQEIKQALVAARVTNPITAVGVAGPAAGVVVSADPPSPAIQQTYVTNWERFSSAHEFGHMIGLIDEYYSAASDETLKAMVSAGWLPPGTRTDHFKVNGVPSVNQKNTAKQAKFMETLQKLRMESPDFAQNPGGPKTTSLMSGGFDVLPIHMVTAHEALVRMTTGLVDEQFWKIT